MSMPASKYAIPKRTVSGSVTLYNNDVLLQVDTSSAPATITLNAIAVDYWETPWRLYIIDYSGNAATNNITINAGTGTDGTQQKINGSNSITIAVNSVGVLIRVLSNTSFIAESTTGLNGHIIQDEGSSLTQRPYLNFVGSGVTATDSGGKTVVTIPGGVTQAYQTVQDEGISLTQRTTINFAGAGVTASDSGGVTLVTIPGSSTGGVTSLTSASLLALISGATVVPGQFYLVTDGGNSKGGVLVQGVTTASVTRYGGALFLNADYQLAGTYPNIPGYGLKGIWSTVAQVPSATRSVVIWNNNHYLNLTGSWGTAPDGDPSDWSLLSKSVSNGYILEIDFVEYDVLANTINYRKDTRGNEVDSYSTTLTDFQWGRDVCSYNKVRGQSTWTATNSNATITGNTVESSTFTETTKTTTPGVVKYNTLLAGSTLTSTNTLGEISYNILDSAGRLVCGNTIDATSSVKRNKICQGSSLTLATVSSTSTIFDNFLVGGSTFTATATISAGNWIKNYLSNAGTMTIIDMVSLSISGCEVSDGIVAAMGSVAANKTNYKARIGFSNWPDELDYSDGAIFSVTTVTIPAAKALYVGVYTIKNCTATNTTKIVNTPTKFPITFRPTNGQNLLVTSVGVGAAVLDQIIDNIGGGGITAVGRTNGCDEITFQRYGTFNGVAIKLIWS